MKIVIVQGPGKLVAVDGCDQYTTISVGAGTVFARDLPGLAQAVYERDEARRERDAKAREADRISGQLTHVLAELNSIRRPMPLTDPPYGCSSGEGTRHDFGDGRGPVPARRHSNGGGWVADTAYVDASAYVGPLAQVRGKAVVCGNALVYDEAQVRDEALVCGKARVCGNALVYGKARVCGKAVVCGKARVCIAQVCDETTNPYDRED